jgi:hypothetical protein
MHPIRLGVSVFFRGALVTVIAVAGIHWGEWREKLYNTRADPQNETQ